MVSFVNPFILNTLPGPSGEDPSYLFGSISNQAGNVSNSGDFEPTLGTVDYSGPTGTTTENSNKLTVQAGDDGDFLGVSLVFYGVENGGSQYTRAYMRNSGGTTITAGAKSERVTTETAAYNRGLISYNINDLVDGDYLEANVFLSNTAGGEWYSNETRLSLLRPGACLATIGLSADQAAANGVPVEFDTVVNGYTDAVDTGSYTIAINKTGWYLVIGALASISSGVICGMTITGSTTGEIVSCAEYSSVGSGNKGQTCARLAYLTKGETVSVTAILGASTTLDADHCFLSIWRIRTTDVVAIIGRGTDYAVPNATSGVKYIPLDDVIEGSGAAVTDNAGAITVQETGWYLPVFGAQMKRGAATTAYAGVGVFNTTSAANGPNYSFEIEQAAGTAYARSGFSPLYCTAGDVVEMGISTISGHATVTLESDLNTHLSLIKLTGAT